VSARRGAEWEAAAAAYLVDRGAEILARNYRRGPGEVDIIARMDGVIALVEVKQRGAFARGTPGEAVTRWKQARISGAALHYLKEHHLLDERIRFDVFEIDPDGLRLIKGAFSYVQYS
jgi:putative endonuclease